MAPRARSATSSATTRRACCGSRAKTGHNVDDVLDAIVERIPPPDRRPARAAARARLRLLYDQYRGVIAFVRVVDGAFSSRAAPLDGARHAFEVEEFGFFAPGWQAAPSLGAGEVGYVITGVKDVGEVHVGDTFTDAGLAGREPLPGYQDVKPMVFCGPLSDRRRGLRHLRDALDA